MINCPLIRDNTATITQGMNHIIVTLNEAARLPTIRDNTFPAPGKTHAVLPRSVANLANLSSLDHDSPSGSKGF